MAHMHVRVEPRSPVERKRNPYKPYRALVDVFLFTSADTSKAEKTVKYFLKDGVLCRGQGGDSNEPEPEPELDDISFPIMHRHITRTKVRVSVKGSDLRAAFARAVEAQVTVDQAGQPVDQDATGGGGGREDDDDGQQEWADSVKALWVSD